jgi:hypothetical protein
VAHIHADRVRDVSTTTGTGNINLAGSPPPGYRAFAAVLAGSDTFHYAIQHQSENEWEVGLGTRVSDTAFARTAVLASSNANNAVSFSAGTKDVALVVPAQWFAERESPVPAVTAQKTDVFSTSTTGSWVDIAGLSVSITPKKATSRILVLVALNFGGSAASARAAFRLDRSGTPIALGDAASARTRASWGATNEQGATGNVAEASSYHWVDSPATTAQRTYKVQMRLENGTGYINRSADDADNADNPRYASTITVLELGP